MPLCPVLGLSRFFFVNGLTAIAKDLGEILNTCWDFGFIAIDTDLDEILNPCWNTGLAESPQVLDDVFSLQTHRHGGIQAVRCETILMDVRRSAYRLNKERMKHKYW